MSQLQQQALESVAYRQIEPSTPAVEEKAKPKRPAKAIAGAVLLFLALLLGWYMASDRLAPSSSSGAVAAAVTQIAPRVSGEVTGVLVSDNETVTAGQKLFELDPRPFDLAVRQAEVALTQAVQANDASEASIAAAQARVDQARANLDTAETSATRTRSLVGRGVVAQSQADSAEANLVSARSALQVAQADMESALLKLGAEDGGNPQIEAARVQLEQAELNRQFATVTAPANGVITNLKLATGQYIGTGAPAMTFIASDALWINADLRENQLANVEPGDTVGILFDGQPGRIYEGRVESVAWGIDTGRTSANGLLQNQASQRWFEPARTIPVRIALDTQSHDWPQNVRVGSKVDVVIYAGGQGNPIAWIANGLQHVHAFLSYLY
jgi:multidrug resistance efflux pump